MLQMLSDIGFKLNRKLQQPNHYDDELEALTSYIKPAVSMGTTGGAGSIAAAEVRALREILAEQSHAIALQADIINTLRELVAGLTRNDTPARSALHQSVETKLDAVVSASDHVEQQASAPAIVQATADLKRATEGFLDALSIRGLSSISGKLKTNIQRARESEAKANLKAIFTATKAIHAERGYYPRTFAESGWSPIQGNRYAYFYGNDIVPASAADAPTALIERARRALGKAGIILSVGTDTFIAAAIADLGKDELDIWTIDQDNNLVHVMDGQ